VLLSIKTPSSDTVANPSRMAVWLFINASESMRPPSEQQLKLVPIPAGLPLFSLLAFREKPLFTVVTIESCDNDQGRPNNQDDSNLAVG